MRVYEFSKKSGVPAKELLRLLRQKGFTVSSHMAQLEPKALDFLKKMTSASTKKIDTSIKKIDIKSKDIQKQSPQITEKEKEVGEANGSERQGVFVLRPMTVGSAAQELNVPVTDMIVILLGWGIVAAKNRVLQEDSLQKLADFYGIKAIQPESHQSEEHVQKGVTSKSKEVRQPIVAVLGHVDHGKTTLLDFIRKTKVVAKEKGGITQHLGAYEATTPQGNIVFIDTPGHEAFSRLRSRGVRVADIVILVVAANDSVKPQTIEAIKQIKAMNVPIIVAVNKIDLVAPEQIEVVKRDLSQYDVLAEDWGGEAIIVPVSAKTGEGIEQLLEVIILQAELMELYAATSQPGECYVLETNFEKGRGAVATLLCQQGTVALGDYFICGKTSGRVNSLIDSNGKRLKKVGPSIPVRVAGFDQLAQAGDLFGVKEKKDMKKSRSVDSRVSEFSSTTQQEDTCNLVLKSDTDSSRGALQESIVKMSKNYNNIFNIALSSVGSVTESDISFASTIGAEILAFHVKVEPSARVLAKKLSVNIRSFDIIYRLLEDLEAYAKKQQKVVVVLKKIGTAEVRKVFNIKGSGRIAGSYVTSGILTKDALVTIWREDEKIAEGTIKSLQRDKKTVKEIKAGYECAFMVNGFDGWIVGDRVECFVSE